MAPKKQTVQEVPTTPEVDWSSLLDQFHTSTRGVLYLKPGRINIRLLPPKGGNPFIPVTSFYQGKRKTKYLVGAWNPEFAEESDSEDHGIRAVLVTKTICQNILTLQVEGYDLFSPVQAVPVGIIKSGSGKNSTTNIVPAPPAKAGSIPADVLTAWEEFDIQELAKSWSASQAQQAAAPSAKTDEDEGDEE